MATTYIPINTGKPLGAAWFNGIKKIQDGINEMLELQAIAATQIDGSDFSLMEQEFGFQPGQGAEAKAELDALLTVLTEPAESVATKNSVALLLPACAQAAAKFGVV